jgi:hypothetical protein
MRDCSYRNWYTGMKWNSNPDKIRDEVLECTVNTLPEALAMMRKWGWAIIRNYDKIVRRVPVGQEDEDSDKDAQTTVLERGSLFSEGNAPTEFQAAYPSTGSFDGTTKKAPPCEPIFEGCRIHGSNYHMAPIRNHTVGDNGFCLKTGNVPRQVFKPNTKALRAYNEHYVGQMEDVIQGMFANEVDELGRNPAANTDNWNVSQSVVWGGIDHQHQHCDQGPAGSFHYEQIFPFVCIHGFGVHEFNMCLLREEETRIWISIPLSQESNAVHAWRLHPRRRLFPSYACSHGVFPYGGGRLEEDEKTLLGQPEAVREMGGKETHVLGA